MTSEGKSHLPHSFWRRYQDSTESQKQVTLAGCQVLLSVVGILLGIVAIVIGIVTVVPILRDLWKAVFIVNRAQLTITFPRDGESVGLGQKVRGNTPFRDMNHYILVTRVSNGDITTDAASVHPDGTFSGEARFGDMESGRDDEFNIQVFTTRIVPPPDTVPGDATLSNGVKVRRTQPEEYIVITSPAEGAVVGLDGTISGRTSLPGLNHYAVITPLKIGTAFVQDRPASVNPVDGTFTVKARFGAAQVGASERFMVRVVATRSTLRAGPLTSEKGAVSSEAVTVTREN